MIEIITEFYNALENLLENIAGMPFFPIIIVFLVFSAFKISIGLLTGGGMYCPNAQTNNTENNAEPKKIDLTKHSDKKEWWEIQIDKEVR